MALPVNIEQLLEGNVVEWERLDFKAGWNPEDVMHSMCAFANDIHNWGGGYIVCGVEEINGRPVLPPVGLELNQLDSIQKKLVEIAAYVQPTVNYVVEPVAYAGKNILVIWVPGGDNRPYKAPTGLGKDALKQGRRYYVRKGSVTCIADADDERRLLALTNKIPFDDRLCHQADVSDLSKFIIADYLKRVGSSVTEMEIQQMSMDDVCRTMSLGDGSTECLKPKNFAILFYANDPEKYIPYARIEIVRFHDDVGDSFDEKVLHGPIHIQLDEAMRYLKEMLVEKVIKIDGQSESIRCWNYPFAALEEVVANAVYHKSWDDRNPIEIRINPTCIEVLNFAGPMPPITNDDLKKKKIVNRVYRNRRIGDLLKELHLTEGRATGFPKIYHALESNGSPLPEFETDANNSYFHATIRIHEAFVDEDLFVACNQLATTVSEYVKELIMSVGTQLMSKQELQLATTLATKSRQYFERVAFKPAQEAGVIIPVGGESIHSPKTKYQLTRLGLALFDKWTDAAEVRLYEK